VVFEAGFVGDDGAEVWAPLGDAAAVTFERVAPMRSFPSYKQQRHREADMSTPALVRRPGMGPAKGRLLTVGTL